MTTFVLLLFFAAADPHPLRVIGAGDHIYHAEVLRVIDGDTVLVWIPLWPDHSITPRIRVPGIDTPETAGKCQEEKELAKKAKAFTAELLPVGSVVKLTGIKFDKFARRYNAVVWTLDGQSLAERLIEANLARAYDGGKRGGWCDS